MDGLTLLKKARAAGLDVLAHGDRLVVRGPRSAEAMAKALLANKQAILPLVQTEQKEPQHASHIDPLIRAFVEFYQSAWIAANRPDPDKDGFLDDIEKRAAGIKHDPAVVLLSWLADKGIAVSARDNRLHFEPSDKLTSPQLRAVAKYKEELLNLTRMLDSIDHIPDDSDAGGKPLDPAILHEWLRAPGDMTLAEFVMLRGKKAG